MSADLAHALRAGSAPPPPPPPGAGRPRRAIVAGGAGALGAAVLEQLLASRVFVHVGVVVTQPLAAAPPGLSGVPAGALDMPAPEAAAAAAASPSAFPVEDTALVVFDRARAANGREQAFLRPDPAGLPALAAGLRRRGARHLVVVLPHAAASLPEALKRGLAGLDEQAVAALDFDHVLFMRPARPPEAVAGRGAMQRLAHGVLGQLRLMVPQQEQPVRAARVAQFAVRLAEALPAAPPGTRVLPAEIVWQASQQRDPAALARAWLRGEALPELVVPRRRF